MSLYAESSAVLRWLLGETGGELTRSTLAGADLVLASELTLIECERALIRAAHGGIIGESAAADRRARLRLAAVHWTLLPLQTEIADRARQSFPRDPVRTLDAIHLATMVVARALVPELRVLSFDERIRRNARDLGFETVPL